MKIFDCTTFFDENLMLEVRFNILNKYVDKFVVAESKYSHSGNKKKLNFDIKKFYEFKKKIIYLPIENEPNDVIYQNENNVVFEDDTSKKVIDLVKDDQSIKKLELIPNSISNNPQPINVLNITFGIGVINRKIEKESRSFTTKTNRIYCLSGIQNRKTDTKIFHKWYHDGKLKSKILLNVGKSFNWRTWSYINVYENRVGEWLVVVEDTLGVRLDSLSFSINSSN